MEPRAKPAKAKVATRPAVARQTRAGDHATVRGLEQRLAEALEQKAAMSEVLSVISHAAFDLQPVFDMVAERAVRLCAANKAFVYRLDGDVLRMAAAHGASPELVEFAARNSIAPGRQSGAARAALTRETVHIADVRTDPEYTFGGARVDPIRTVLAVPILKRSQLLGVVVIYRLEVKPFTDAQITLIQAFADQAAIAIENVRLLAELQARNRELTVALDEKTATGEILRVISRSQTDVQPVFDAIADSVLRLCDARFSSIYRFDGELIHLVALANVTPEAAAAFRSVYPTAPGRGGATHRAILTRGIVHIPDVHADSEYVFHDAARTANFRSALSVPMLRDGNPIGTITVYRDEATPFPDSQIELLKTFADQAVIAIENARLFRELGTRNAELTEALEQQTATSEILRVISRSPTDVQPVFDTIAAAALKLCAANSANVFTVDGEWVRLAALGNPQGGDAIRRNYPRPIGRDNAAGRAVLTCEVVTIPDVLEDPEYGVGAAALAGGFRSVLAVPLIREERPIGAITVGRPEPGPFSDKQVALLRIFADQAVIAIENVRLFKALESRNSDLTIALDHQTATSEILRVISSVQTDVQPVFDTIVRNAVRLCGADHGLAARFDGKLLHPLAHYGFSAEALEMTVRKFPMRPSRENLLGRAALTRTVENLPDMLADPDYSREFTIAGGWRSGLSVPMLRDGQIVGAIAVSRTEVGAFPDHLVKLLGTFADQAVIAIENVRLFTELQDRNSALTEALERQTATSEILRVISRSPTNVQPVFDTIAAAALTLCSASSATVTTFDGELLHIKALAVVNPEGAEAVRRLFPRPPSRDITASRAILTCGVVAIPDVLEDAEFAHKASAVAGGFRSTLAVPLMREGKPIGAIVVGRPRPGRFADQQTALLQTFADQAVIAIENVRLFTELQARNSALTEALEQQTATSEILRVISSSPTDVQPVFDIIGESAEKLCAAEISIVSRVEGERIHAVAIHGVSAEGRAAIGRRFPMRLDAMTVTARAIRDRAVVHSSDVLAEPDYETKDAALAAGFRGSLGVPMLREGQVIGAIFVGRRIPGLFADSQVDLLKTFADQAVIAVENVRLFKELDVRNRDLTEALEQQTATSEVLKVISRSAFDLQPVLDIVIERAARLCGAEHGHVHRFDGEFLRLAAGYSAVPAMLDYLRDHPARLGPGSISGMAGLERRLIHWHDVLEQSGYQRGEAQKLGGFRTMLAVPMLSAEALLGVMVIWKTRVEPFTDKQIEVVTTFADQAVIAIENVRLFKELEVRNRDLTEALEQQTATSEILRVISQSQTNVQPVFESIATAALELCRARSAIVTTFDGGLIRLAATANLNPEGANAIRHTYPRSPDRSSANSRAILTSRVVAIPDILDDPDYSVRAAALASGFRSVLAVPLIRDGAAIGAISTGRPEPGPFPDKQVALLRTFADQAVIAIENVRLFTELEARTGELTRSVGELKALGEVGQAVSSTLDLETVLSTIVSRATQLAGMDGGAIHEYDEASEVFHLHTTHRLPDELVAVLRATQFRKGEGAVGKLAMTGEPVEIRDITDADVYQSRVRDVIIQSGFRSLLAVPLLREDHLLGGLVVCRNTPGAFAPEVIELLKTFATQSALAIQNARLFREIEDKGRQLETASRHKSEFLANMSHELRTPLNAIIGFSEVLSERMFGEINDKQAEYLTDILESGRHLLSLINDILDLAKIEAGRMELEPADFNLAAAIDNTLVLVRERAQRRGITLTRSIDERLGDIRADERKVKQVLLNLLSNALKFTPEGGRIAVAADVRDGAAEISVTDTGVGIAPEDQAAVFEEFRQVGATARKVEGTGLGLAISRKFIELHGGRIRVESVVGTGSTFAFTLPLPDGRHAPSG